MRKFHRVITAAVLSAPMALAIGGAASAEEGPSYDQHAATAGPNGVATQQITSQQNGDQGGSGSAQYQQDSNSAGPDGASSEHTSSNSGDNGGLLGVLSL